MPENLAKWYVLPLKSTEPKEVNGALVNDDIDDIIATHGADISGFMVPSYLGPILEKEAIPPPTKDPLDALY